MRKKIHVSSILDKSEILSMDFVNFILESVVSSAKFGLLLEDEGNGKIHKARANINGMLVLPFGSGKTSSLVNIHNAILGNDLTMAGLVGTISKEGNFLPGTCIQAGGKVLFIDEFQKIGDNVKNALNSLLEYPHNYTRNLGFHVNHPTNRKKKFYEYHIKNGEIQMVSKFSCLVSGMFVSKHTTISKAWFSRFVPIRFIPSMDYYEKLTSGDVVWKINPSETETDFTFPKYLDFHKDFWKIAKTVDYFKLPERKSEIGYLTRLLQDLARMSAFICSLDKRTEIIKDDYTRALKLFDNIMASYITWDLDELDMFIIQNVNEKTQTEIAGLLNIKQPSVNERIERLKKKGLLRILEKPVN